MYTHCTTDAHAPAAFHKHHLGLTAGIGAREIKLYKNVTLHLHAACGYWVKLQCQKYTERRTTMIHTEKIRRSTH